MGQSSAIDWGTVPQWLGLAAGFVAVIAFVASRRDIARTHASQVYVLVKRHHFNSERIELEEGYDLRMTLDVIAELTNAGTTPITECYLTLYAPGGRRRRFWWSSLRNTDWWTTERIFGNAYYTIAAESAGEALEFHGPIRRPEKVPLDLPTIIARFTDSAGRRWIRFPDGRLRRIRRSWMVRGRRKEWQRRWRRRRQLRTKRVPDAK